MDGTERNRTHTNIYIDGPPTQHKLSIKAPDLKSGLSSILGLTLDGARVPVSSSVKYKVEVVGIGILLSSSILYFHLATLTPSP